MAEATPQLSLSIGDRVVYPNQGVCRVSGVEDKEVAGQRLTFVTMRREEDGAVVMVPQAKIRSIGLRKVATADEVAKIFAFLKSDSEKADLDWKQRARANVDRMTQGGIRGLAEVVKGLQVLSELRPLPAKERELYDNARHLLVTEIAVALGIPEVDAEDAIDIVLFPPGKERPKRTVAEFKPEAEEGEDLGIADDLLGIDGGDLDLPAEEEAPEPEEEAAEPAEEKAPPKKAKLSDDEITETMGQALLPEALLPPKRKRGRPPKAKPAEKPAPAAVPKEEAPKKRGRPPKAKAVVEVESPAKRGRPSKKDAKAKKK